MKFTKMQANGNDYIYIYNFSENPIDYAYLSKKLCARHFGIGADGLIAICSSKICDYKMRVFNPDGSEAEMCGNALRSSSLLLYKKGIVPKSEISAETLGGIKHITISSGGKSAVTDIGKGIITAKTEYTLYGKTFGITAVSLGNPHCVVKCESINDVPINKYGSFLETCELFPQRANVHFCKNESRNQLYIRSYERGCGETLSCATGCAACLVAAYNDSQTERKVKCRQTGGCLDVEIGDNGNIFITGSAEIVYEGSVDI